MLLGQSPSCVQGSWGDNVPVYSLLLAERQQAGCVPLCSQNVDRLDSEIIYDRDFDYDYFGFKVSSWQHGPRPSPEL